MKEQAVLEGILEVVLRPIVRLCLRHALKAKELNEILKRVFVLVSVDELKRADKEVSASRVRVMSGVHRAEVARIIAGKSRPTRTADVVTKVIGQWRSHKKYTSPAGKPRILTADGMNSEFVALVQSVSVDLNPYTVLFEMERLGLVEKGDQGIQLLGTVYIPKDAHEGYALMADDVEDLMETVQHNIVVEPEDRALHIKTEYDNISPMDLPEIRSWVRHEGSRFHAQVRKFLAKFDRDLTSSKKSIGGRVRVALGSFCRAEILDPGSEKERSKK